MLEADSLEEARLTLESLVSRAQQSSPESVALLRAQLSEAVAILSTEADKEQKQQPQPQPQPQPQTGPQAQQTPQQLLQGSPPDAGSTIRSPLSVEVAFGGATRRVTPARSRTAAGQRGCSGSSIGDHDKDDMSRQRSLCFMNEQIMQTICSHFNSSTLCRAMSVCQSWKLAARDERLWMWLFLNSSCLSRPTSIPTSWRQDYGEGMRLRSNWLVGRCLVTRLTGHKESVNCFASHGDLIVSGADDNDLRVWDLERSADDQCSLVLTGHTGKVLCCCIVRGMVVSGGEDKAVIVWDLKTGKILSSLKQHTGAVLCMCTDGQRYVYTGGADHDVCKWSIETLKCEGVMKKHRAPILCICLGFDNGYVITGGRDRDACLWNIACGPTAALKMTLVGHEAAITCLHASEKGLREGHPSHSGHSAQNDGGVIVTGSDDKTVRVWNAASGNVLKIVGEHGGPVSCVLLQPGRIISACFDGKVRFIDILTGSCIRTVAGHRNAVMSIDAKGSIVISGGNDRDLRVWDMDERSVAPSASVKASANRVTVKNGGLNDDLAEAAAAEETRLGYALSGHNSGIQKVKIVGERIVTASDDYELRVWDFSSWPKAGGSNLKSSVVGKIPSRRKTL